MRRKKIKYNEEEARKKIQENMALAGGEIQEVLKKYGLKFQTVYSIQLVPNIIYKNKRR